MDLETTEHISELNSAIAFLRLKNAIALFSSEMCSVVSKSTSHPQTMNCFNPFIAAYSKAYGALVRTRDLSVPASSTNPIVASNFPFTLDVPSSLPDKLDMASEIRSIIESVEFSNQASAFSPQLLIIDSNWDTVLGIVQNVCTILGSLFVILAACCRSFLASVCCVTSMLVAMCIEFYLLHLMDFAIDAVFLINMTLVLGLCIDPMSHITFCYTREAGTAGEKLQSTLTKVMEPVLHGILTTAIGISITAAGSSVLIITFFAFISLALLCTLVVTSTLLPTLLYLLAPADPDAHAR